MIPAYYRKSQTHRALWATMKALAEHDDIGPVAKASVSRRAVANAIDRRLTILEHEASEKIKAYFQHERERMVGAVKLHGLDAVDDVLHRLRPELRSLLTSLYQTAAQDWARWVQPHMPRSAKKGADDQPRDEHGRWTATIGKIRNVLTPDLLHPKYRDAGATSCDPKVAGHCYAATEALYHMGAKKAGFRPFSIRHENSVHWFLKNDKTGEILDPTGSQFHEPVPYDKATGRGFLTTQPSARAKAIMDRVAGRVAKADDDKPLPRPVAGPIGVGALEGPIDVWIAENIGKKITDISESSRSMIASQIRSGMKEGESLGQIARRLDNFYLEDIIPNRSMVIARTETGSITNWIQNMIARDTQAQGVNMEKEWMSLRDQRTRPTHREADGQRVALDEPFQVGDALLMFPLDPSGPPEEVIECRCGVMYHVVDEEKAALARFERFAKSVAGIDNGDVATALGFASGVFAEGDDWIETRARLMKSVYRIRRATEEPVVVKAGPPDEPRDKEGKWTEGAGDTTPDHTDHPDNTGHMPEAQRERIKHYEKELKARNVGGRGGMGTERMVVIAPDGKVLIDKEGKKNSVSFSGTETKAMKGGVGTHNHPANVTLSAQDVETAWVADLTEIRAVGNHYTYSLKPMPGKQWPNRLVLHAMSRQHLDPLIRESEKKAEELYGAEGNAIDRKDREAVKKYNKKLIAWNLVENARIQHAAWLKAAPLLSLDYTRTKNGAK